MDEDVLRRSLVSRSWAYSFMKQHKEEIMRGTIDDVCDGPRLDVYIAFACAQRFIGQYEYINERRVPSHQTLRARAHFCDTGGHVLSPSLWYHTCQNSTVVTPTLIVA